MTKWGIDQALHKLHEIIREQKKRMPVMTNASKYGILMHSVDNFIHVTVRDTKEAAMSLLQSVLLGLIQGLTEFLPVSSSGHLAIFKQFFK